MRDLKSLPTRDFYRSVDIFLLYKIIIFTRVKIRYNRKMLRIPAQYVARIFLF